MVPRKLVEDLAEAERIVALTGSGISVESGIPTFRGKGGLWEGYRVEDVATPEAFSRDPNMVWRFYDERRQSMAGAKPNRAHSILASLEKLYDLWVITQNIDGLHFRAGSRNVIELHGNIWRVRCTRCGVKYYNYEVPLSMVPPRCRKCGGLLRPDVVWFNEPVYDIERAYKLSRECDIMLVIGTSSLVYPAAHLPRVAWSRGAKIVEINPQKTPVSEFADYVIRGKATLALEEIYKKLRKRD